MASKWKELGKALSLNENLIDEVDTNNENNEACLQELLTFYMMRTDLKHNLEEINTALGKIGEDKVHLSECDLQVAHGDKTAGVCKEFVHVGIR